MTIDTTYPPAPLRPRRAPRSRKEPARLRRHRRIDIGRRRGRFTRLPPAINPSVALAHFMDHGDFYRIDKINYLVVAVRDDMLDALIVASAASEDDGLCLKRDGSVVTEDDEEDNEDVGIDDEPHGDPWMDMEPSLAGISAGMQPGIDMGDREGPDADDEPDHDGETLDADGSTSWSVAI